jgi:hypothetical protein
MYMLTGVLFMIMSWGNSGVCIVFGQVDLGFWEGPTMSMELAEPSTNNVLCFWVGGLVQMIPRGSGWGCINSALRYHP